MNTSQQKFNLALITGANSGIGEALCHLLADQGINLIITARDSARLNALTEKLKYKIKVISFTADLGKHEDRQIVIDYIQKHQPDLVINNAGYGLYGDALTHTTQEQLEILNVNGNCVLELTLEAARTMIQAKKQGVILNVSSVASFYVFPGLAVYSAAKSFVTQVSQALDIELQPQGIRILVSCPGIVATDFARRAAGSAKSIQSSSSMSSEFAAKEIWKQIQKRKACHIFNWKYRWSLYLSKLLPAKSLAKILRLSILQRNITK
jgi:short-subunit dehydrogenase